MISISEIIQHIEQIAPPALKESYDNVGLLVGSPTHKTDKALLCIDITEEIIDEAIRKNAGLIIAHHPIIFGGIKKLTGSTYVERSIIKAIKHDIAIYAAHTNLDAITGGVSFKMAEKLHLKNCRVLQPSQGTLSKLVTFVPVSHVEPVRKALFDAGAGNIGNYDSCSFNTEGAGTFRANEHANPFVGEIGVMHTEREIRIETVFPSHLQHKIIHALRTAHPYEEVAFDVYRLQNPNPEIGMGVIGELETETDALEFAQMVKKIFSCQAIRHTAFPSKKIKTVALCGGSGSSLLHEAMAQKADAFVSADFTYHKFFDAENRIFIVDTGHFESEQFTVEIFYEILSKKIANFAFLFSEINTNPINYL